MTSENLALYHSRRANPTTYFLLHFILGWSYGSLNAVGLQVAFYLTLGGLGFWWFIRIFTVMSAVKAYNRDLALQLGANSEDLVKLRLN